jgi:uncharacterized membrane protein YfhO
VGGRLDRDRNGKKAEIEKVNVGFMAVKVPEGASDIRFNYTTPGLKLGALVTLGGIALFALYYVLVKRMDKKTVKKRKIFRVKEFIKSKEEEVLPE